MVAGDNGSYNSSTDSVTHWNIGWALTYSVVALLVCVSNLLIMVAFTTKDLRKRSYYQVINLSVADLAVGIIVMPLHIFIGTISKTYSTKESVTDALYFTDLLFGLASFLILSVISCERLYAVARPYRHRLLQKRHYAMLLALPWIIAAVDAAADGWPMPAWLPFRMYLLVISLALIVISCSYVAIWIKKTSSFRSESQRGTSIRLKHKRLAKTLFITTIASLITWLPFYTYLTYHDVCEECPAVPIHIFYALKLLQFSNSFINGIVYSLRMPKFRRTIRRVFRGKFARNSKNTRNTRAGVSRYLDVDRDDKNNAEEAL